VSRLDGPAGTAPRSTCSFACNGTGRDRGHALTPAGAAKIRKEKQGSHPGSRRVSGSELAFLQSVQEGASPSRLPPNQPTRRSHARLRGMRVTVSPTLLAAETGEMSVLPVVASPAAASITNSRAYCISEALLNFFIFLLTPYIIVLMKPLAYVP
jgi:hypothetical protein